MAPPDETAAPPLPDAERAFELGDWHAARAIARRELDSPAADEPRRAAARAMLDRFRPDPQLLALYAACLLFFAVAVFTYLRH